MGEVAGPELADCAQCGVSRVGFIGVGNQGGPIARRIGEAGWPLTLWARRADALDPFDDVATRSDSPEALAALCDLLCICVVDHAGVTDLFDRILPAIRAGNLIAVLSTVHPDTYVSLAELANAQGVALIDAPVSGGAGGAAAGTLTVMMGGSEVDCARVLPVFRSFGELIVRLGPVGAGQRAKLLNNTLLAAILDATQDARETGVALGLDLAALDSMLAESSGNNFGLQILRSLPSLAAFVNG
ncbi:MAG: NAD(P)-dependent oxidoreductase, partial [Sphingobium sp.]